MTRKGSNIRTPPSASGPNVEGGTTSTTDKRMLPVELLGTSSELLCAAAWSGFAVRLSSGPSDCQYFCCLLISARAAHRRPTGTTTRPARAMVAMFPSFPSLGLPRTLVTKRTITALVLVVRILY
eukprot:TRINITY_DN5093_c0_g2_i3.p1 TRINITY_DN5093_c0_g2~~TRINITY_DN5093_c0_g2_i3.p1  ORF type:complete len:125 (+),score=3.22 TRINITY_DN5093_c0_g2_i3:149-523(+)